MIYINESIRYVYDASTYVFYELTHVFEQFWLFGSLGFWGFGILGFWVLGFGVLINRATSLQFEQKLFFFMC